MSNHIIMACNVTHIKQVLCGCYGVRFSFVLCARDCVLFMGAWEKKPKRGEKKRSDIETDRQKTTTQTSL